VSSVSIRAIHRSRSEAYAGEFAYVCSNRDQKPRADEPTDTGAPPKRSSSCKGPSKRESALLVQLRTEKLGLNDFLFSRSVPGVSNPQNNYGERRKAVAHIPVHCSMYKDLPAILSKPQLATKAIDRAAEMRRRRRALGKLFYSVGAADATDEAAHLFAPR
jgi:hypothetical protein